MKTRINGCIFVFTFIVLLIASTSPVVSESTGDLIVDISGFPSSDGFAMVALSNSEESYEGGETSVVAKAKARVIDQKAQVIFANLSYGSYGVSVYHDENTNGKMDSNLMGIPKEAYGFSNNAKGFFGKPSYKDVVLQLNSAEKRINIKLD